MADALHSIKTHCLSRDMHTTCSNYANEQLATCSPDDLNCQCSKVAEIQNYCQEVCNLSDYVSDSTRFFLEETCKPEKLGERDASEGQSALTGEGSWSNEFIQGLAMKQIMEPNQLPHGLSNLIEDHLSPAVSRLTPELHSGIDITPKRGESNERIEKRSATARDWTDVNFKLHYLDPQTGEIFTADFIDNWDGGDDNNDDKHLQEDPLMFYEEQSLLVPMDTSVPSMENPPPVYRDTTVPDDEFYYYHADSPDSPEEYGTLTLYFDISEASLEPVDFPEFSAEPVNFSEFPVEPVDFPELPGEPVDFPEYPVEPVDFPELPVEPISSPAANNTTGMLSKLRQKLNIHLVTSAHGHGTMASQLSYANSTAVTTSSFRTNSRAFNSKSLPTNSQRNSNSSAALAPQTASQTSHAGAIRPALAIAFISTLITIISV